MCHAQDAPRAAGAAPQAGWGSEGLGRRGRAEHWGPAHHEFGEVAARSYGALTSAVLPPSNQYPGPASCPPDRYYEPLADVAPLEEVLAGPALRKLLFMTRCVGGRAGGCCVWEGCLLRAGAHAGCLRACRRQCSLRSASPSWPAARSCRRTTCRPEVVDSHLKPHWREALAGTGAEAMQAVRGLPALLTSSTRLLGAVRKLTCHVHCLFYKWAVVNTCCTKGPPPFIACARRSPTCSRWCPLAGTRRARWATCWSTWACPPPIWWPWATAATTWAWSGWQAWAWPWWVLGGRRLDQELADCCRAGLGLGAAQMHPLAGAPPP